MKILLTTLNAKYIHLNLAIRLLYDLNKEHADIDWKEFTIKEDKDEVAQYMARYELVALSCYIWNITQTLEVAQKIKQINPACKILLGGPEVSYDFQDIIALPYIDFIITGEGEIPFTTFIKNYPTVNEVPNLVWKDTEQAIFYYPQKVDFSLLAYEHRNPYIYDQDGDLYNKVAYIETSRGCPYKCEFCLASLDNKVRYLPTATIKEQLLYLMQRGRVIKFLDRTFNVKKDFTIEIFKFILEHHQPENVFQFEITADIVHPDIIAFINEQVPKGLFRFEIGIQTVNQQANLEVKRKQNFDKTAGVIKQLQDKIEMHLDLIVGLPLDYLPDIKYSFEEVFNLYPPELQLGFLKFLKGTPIRERYEQYGYEFDPAPPYQLIKSNFLSAEELRSITHLEHVLELYWNKKRAIHTLKYIHQHYSIFDFLCGLGTYFIEKYGPIHFTLTQQYEALRDYCLNTYPEDLILQDFIAIDYYLQHSLKPKPFILEELDKKEKNKLLEDNQLNIHQGRYFIATLNFDWEHYCMTNELLKTTHYLGIHYQGTGIAAKTIQIKRG